MVIYCRYERFHCKKRKHLHAGQRTPMGGGFRGARREVRLRRHEIIGAQSISEEPIHFFGERGINVACSQPGLDMADRNPLIKSRQRRRA